MVGGIPVIIVGLFCIILGFINTRGNISSLHSYHRHRVSPEDVPIFGKLVGAGMMIIGASIIILGIFIIIATEINNPLLTLIGTAIFGIGFIIGLVLSFYAMIKYNKGIF